MLLFETVSVSLIERNLEYTNKPNWSVALADVNTVEIGPSSVWALYELTHNLIQAKAYFPLGPNLNSSASSAKSSIVGWKYALSVLLNLSNAYFK